MHYQINNSILIKSENAAKSTKQPNKVIIEYIDKLSSDFHVLDYGCGKLRYSIPLCSKVEKVIAIDSEHQITRFQIINNIRTTVVNYARRFSTNLDVYSESNTKWMQMKFQFILCTNVLSAVPNREDRLKILRNIKSVLEVGGQALISVQYRNSYFSGYSKRDNSIQYSDGWILRNRSGNTFYGLITPENLLKLCAESNLNVIDVKLDDGSVYMIVE